MHKAERTMNLLSPSLISIHLSHEIKRKESYDKPTRCIKKQTHHFADKGPSIKAMFFSSSHVWMWELDNKEGWVPKNCFFWAVVLEKTLLDFKEIKPINPKRNQPWIFIGGIGAEAEVPIFGHLMWRDDSLEKILMLEKTKGKRRG